MFTNIESTSLNDYSNPTLVYTLCHCDQGWEEKNFSVSAKIDTDIDTARGGD